MRVGSRHFLCTLFRIPTQLPGPKTGNDGTGSLADRSSEQNPCPGTALNLLEVDEGAGRVLDHSSIVKLKIKFFLGQLASSRLHCDTLANQLAAAQTKTEKKKIFCRYQEALNEAHAFELLLERLQQEMREQSAEDGLGKAPSKTAEPIPPEGLAALASSRVRFTQN